MKSLDICRICENRLPPQVDDCPVCGSTCTRIHWRTLAVVLLAVIGTGWAFTLIGGSGV